MMILVVLKKQKLRDIGFKKGIIDGNALILTLMPILLIIVQIFILDKTVCFTLGFALFSSVILAPVTEEIFFRGYLLEKLNVFSNKYYAILISAFLFGFIHLPRLSIGMYDPAGFVFTFILGGLFGWVYCEGKSLAYPIVFHALWNLSASIF